MYTNVEGFQLCQYRFLVTSHHQDYRLESRNIFVLLQMFSYKEELNPHAWAQGLHYYSN